MRSRALSSGRPMKLYVKIFTTSPTYSGQFYQARAHVLAALTRHHLRHSYPRLEFRCQGRACGFSARGPRVRELICEAFLNQGSAFSDLKSLIETIGNCKVDEHLSGLKLGHERRACHGVTYAKLGEE